MMSLLKEYGIPHNLLNAKPENLKREAEIIAQAGRKGAVTIATNIAKIAATLFVLFVGSLKNHRLR